MRLLPSILLTTLLAGCGGDPSETDASTSESGEGTTDPSTGASSTSTTGGPLPTGTDTAGTATDDGSTSTTTNDPSTGGGSTTSTGTTDTTGTTGDPTGTDSGSETGSSPAQNATAEDVCGLDDGPAVEFRFDLQEPTCGAPDVADQVSIFVFSNGAPLAPGDYIIPDQASGMAAKQGQQPIAAMAGYVTVDSWVDGTVTGSYSLHLPGDTIYFGEFVGPHCQTMPMCG